MVTCSPKASNLAKKIAFVRRARLTNYKASLELEGFDVAELGEHLAHQVKAELIEKYRTRHQ